MTLVERSHISPEHCFCVMLVDLVSLYQTPCSAFDTIPEGLCLPLYQKGFCISFTWKVGRSFASQPAAKGKRRMPKTNPLWKILLFGKGVNYSKTGEGCFLCQQRRGNDSFWLPLPLRPSLPCLQLEAVMTSFPWVTLFPCSGCALPFELWHSPALRDHQPKGV